MARLPILMYHSVCTHSKDSKGLTISVAALEAQCSYLANNGYHSFHFSELENFNNTKQLPKKSVIITFDDVYVNQYENAYPLLKKYNLKSTFFIPFKFVDAYDSWHSNSKKIMSITQLKALDPAVVELGMHSFNHDNYNTLSAEEIRSDFEGCDKFIRENQLKINRSLAYPFGKYPRKNPEKNQFFNALKEQQIIYGLRIGNRVNLFPFRNNYEVQRIDIKGEDSLNTFKMKLRFGKLGFF